MSKKTRFLSFGGLACLLLLTFAWGFFTHRNRIFPYSILHGWRRGAAEERLRERGVGAFPKVRVSAEDLRDLPYVAGSVTAHPERVGVVVHDAARAWRGVNFFVARGVGAALLIDMDGRVLHEWRCETRYPWEAAQLLPGGNVLLIVPGVKVVMLSVRGETIWEREGNFHHQPLFHDGSLYVLEWRVAERPEIRAEGPIYDEFLVRFDLDGAIEEEISLSDVILGSAVRELLPSMDEYADLEVPVDLFHINSVRILEGSPGRGSPLDEPGSMLLSVRNLNTVLIFDPRTGDVRWFWGPNNLTLQHDARLLDSGNILVFNNGTEQSEVLEVDPRSNRVTWRFSREGFYSRTRGSAQRLPNGNTLITESDRGRVFEVTADGDVVWAFEGPILAQDQLRGAIWRMTRYPESSLDFELQREPDPADEAQ